MADSLVNEQAIFDAARAIKPAEAREAYLQEACGDNSALRQRIQALLAAYDESQNFLESPLYSLRPAPHLDPPSAEQPGTMIGPYELLEIIGEGGMGIVYRAQQTEPVARQVALKIIKPGLDSRQVIARFEVERQALALMDHPNIAKVLDAGTTQASRLYFVMELVLGTPITKYCDEKHLSLRQRLELMIPVCQAIQHAHQKGIIHRDIKPSNVLIASYDGRPVPKVIDFGVAKATQSQNVSDGLSAFTAHGQVVGTLEYMSPEQAELDQFDIDTRSDVDSLGVLLYELLTGCTPFDKTRFRSAAFHEMLRIIREDEPPTPSTRLSSIDKLPSIAALRGIEPARLTKTLRGELDWIVMKTLEKDRNRRYETASGLALDLQRYLSDEPVLARRPTTLYRLRKFLRRHASSVATAMLVVSALTIVGGTLTVHYAGIAAHRRQTNQQIEYALSAAQAAIDARDLTLAEMHLAEARGRLGNQTLAFSIAAGNIDRLAKEVAARRADDDRFATSMKLAREAADNMSYSSIREGHIPAKQALDFFGVLKDAGWRKKLDDSYLSTEQKAQVVETAYQTLVNLADYGVRWRHQWLPAGEELPVTTLQSLELLEKAESFHQPTRALWFVRKTAYIQLNDKSNADESNRLFLAAKPVSAWDYYLPGHSAGWEGKLNEAIESYQAALRIQPDHYNSLFFQADRLSYIRRTPEAIQLFTACIALRPQHLFAYQSRAKLFENQKKLSEAEADYSAAILAVDNEYDRFSAYNYRREFYLRTYRTDLADADCREEIVIGERFLRDEGSTIGANHPKVIHIKDYLVALYNRQRRYDDAIALGQEMLQWRQSHQGRTKRATLTAMSHLGNAYRGARRLNEAIALETELVTLAKQHLGATDAHTLTHLHNLGRSHAAFGNWEKAVSLYEETLKHRKAKLGAKHKSTLLTMNMLATAYRDMGHFEKAVPLFQELVATRTQQLGPQHTDTLSTAASLGGTLLEQKKFLQAEVVLRKCLDDSESAEPDHWTTFHRKSLLGAALVGQAAALKDSDSAAAQLKLDKAERLLVEGYDGLKARADLPLKTTDRELPPSRLADAARHLVDLYTLRENPALAAKWQKELEILTPITP